MDAPRPRDFDPYRPEITDCHCSLCTEIAYALSSVLAGSGSARHLDACRALLGALRAGEHKRVTFAEFVDQARERQAARLAELRAAGAPASEIAVVERGYVKIDMAFMVDGAGVGIGGRIQ